MITVLKIQHGSIMAHGIATNHCKHCGCVCIHKAIMDIDVKNNAGGKE